MYITDVKGCAVFRGLSVPFSVVQFLVAFLDGALLYIVHYSNVVKGQLLQLYTCMCMLMYIADLPSLLSCLA